MFAAREAGAGCEWKEASGRREAGEKGSDVLGTESWSK